MNRSAWNAIGPLGITSHTGEPCPGALRSGPCQNRPLNRSGISSWRTPKQKLKNFPHDKEPDALIRRARQLETASRMNQWLSSPALKAPQ
jgi:hypothetical protein